MVRIAEINPGNPFAFATVSFFDQDGCLGNELDSKTTLSLIGDTGGAWRRRHARDRIPSGASSALVSFVAVAGPEVPFGFDTSFDSLELRQSAGAETSPH